MDTVIAWLGFFGAWLLFGGPVYQAALELREQEVARSDIERAMKGLEQRKVSAWWWLVPPVKLYLEHRANEEFQRAAWERLGATETENLLNYINKATGWLMVGTGGLFIAAKETWELVEHEEGWPAWVFAPLIVAMPALCLLFVAVRIRRSADMLARKRAESGAEAEAG